MTLKIRKAAVLGAGVMGAQIAAYLAAAGVRVHLLDLASKEPPTDPALKKLVGKNFRSAAAVKAIEHLKKLKPSPLVSDRVLANLIPGNFEDDMPTLASTDWIIEAVVEKMDIKRKIIRQIAQYAPQHIPITSNTSGLSMAQMCAEEDEFFQKRFFGTHFFNPPRYMKLVEIVPHKNNDMQLVNNVAEWIESRLGKGIVYTKDTVNFIANRVGVFGIQAVVKHTKDFNLNVETADALTGKLIGRSSSASYRTVDVVGLDTYCHVAKNVYDVDPKDPYRDWFIPHDYATQLVQKGALGSKSGDTGFYKKTKVDGQTKILAYHFDKQDYGEQNPKTYPWMEAASKEPNTFKRIRHILEQQDEGARFVWACLRDTFSYCSLMVEEIANNDLQALDQAICWGFNWEYGPFQLWQGIGYDYVLERMQQDKTKLPNWCKPKLEFYKPSPASQDFLLSGATEQFEPKTQKYRGLPKKSYEYFLPKFENKADKRLVLSNVGASLVDIGHGVACLTFHTKMNAINGAITEMTFQAIEKVQKDFSGLVIANAGDNFSAGADLKEILKAITAKDFASIDKLLRQFQGSMQMLKYAAFPTVSAPHALTLGGGCEFSLHTSAQILAGETYAGLVEAGVGLIPGGGGLKELALRAYDMMSITENGDPMPFLMRAFMLVGMGRVSTSGQEALEMGLYDRRTASVSLSRDHLVDRAKGMVLEMLNRGYAAPTPRENIRVVGDPGVQTFNMMLYNMVQARQASPYDALIGEKIATVLCGGDIDGGEVVNESYFLDLERRCFLELCQEQKTAERIEHMLKTGKPLRN